MPGRMHWVSGSPPAIPLGQGLLQAGQAPNALRCLTPDDRQYRQKTVPDMTER